MPTTEIDVQELQDAINSLQEHRREYDRDEELACAGDFVRDFGTFGQLFEGVDLHRAQHWNGHPSAAWGMLAHWSVERGDPIGDSDAPFTHSETCVMCAFLEDVAVLREEYEGGCVSCGRDLAGHDVAMAEDGSAVASCKVWTRREPFAHEAYPSSDNVDDSVVAFEASWWARMADGNFALVTRTYYRAFEENRSSGEYDGPRYIEREDEYLVCTDLSDPGGTELNAAYMYSAVDVDPDSDPHALATDSFEPEADEWREYAPKPYNTVQLEAVSLVPA